MVLCLPGCCGSDRMVVGFTTTYAISEFKKGYVAPRLKSSLQKLYGRYHNLVDRYEISISQMTMDLLLFT